jgi:type II restriction/modification system DNA methylase subunit YeeA
MNKANLKSYAPQARLDFIAAVTARANLLGITSSGVSPVEVRGDIAIIEGREWPAKISELRDKLIIRIKRHGFEQSMEEVAYTWFNRFAALRYMEIHDFLGHGWRALSSRDGGLPEILSHASELSLSGLRNDRVREMQLAGNQDNELYKLLLVAQCNELSRSMPFLFERIDDETELLLPENLLRTDSILLKMIEAIGEEDWSDIEIIGWLYQFYISAKKEIVIGKVVQSEDIPAATQLFTPNWIVQYLVQNSVGRLWLMANPTSTLANQWKYYVSPAEQLPEDRIHLNELIQARIQEDGGSLNPEYLSILDPACGSGHILVVAYDVLKAIYLERGYRLRDIPRLILEKNLYGLDIDERAAQMASFALLMKARADDRSLLSDQNTPPRLNVLSLQESNGLDFDELSSHVSKFGGQRATIKLLIDSLENAKTYGSLIQIPKELKDGLEPLATALKLAQEQGDLYEKAASQDLLSLTQQAKVLSMQFDAVIANPPYMGGKSMTAQVKLFAEKHYKEGKADLFAMFILRCHFFGKQNARIALMTPFVWMFLNTYESIRDFLTNKASLASLVHPEYHSFFESAFVPVCAFIVDASGHEAIGKYFDLTKYYGAELQPVKFLEAIDASSSLDVHSVNCREFSKIKTTPIAYWVSSRMRESINESKSVGDFATTKQGLITGNNGRFLRYWHEVDFSRIGNGIKSRSGASLSEKKWFPCVKGGAFRKWYGNNDYVVDWESDGENIKEYRDSVTGKQLSRPQNLDYYFREGLTWSTLTVGPFSMRWTPIGSVFESKGSMCFAHDSKLTKYVLAYLNTKLVNSFLRASSPTLDYHEGPVARLPMRIESTDRVIALADQAISISRADWDCFEGSVDFGGSPLLETTNSSSLGESWNRWSVDTDDRIRRLHLIEENINRIFIELFGLQDEISPDVPIEQITLAKADREKDALRLLSYAIGCMMGRYSLDESGLIYADAGNDGFDPSRYSRFPASSVGIIPMTDENWFSDDASTRVREFLKAAWGDSSFEENLVWLAESLGQKTGSTPDEAIRRYLSDKFYKDHLQSYKRRPIYWLFSSGKQGAFKALVYMHRYNSGTLSRMRSEYVVPLSAKFAGRIEFLDKDANASSSPAARTKIQKQIETMRKKQAELLTFDERLRHYADMRITINLDDGVKANYAKFGDLVAESKAISGGADV